MALLSISAAARAAGKDRGTIQRFINSGKLSVTKDATGKQQVDTSELLRVFGELKNDAAAGVAAEMRQCTTASSSGEVQYLLEKVAALEADKVWLKERVEFLEQRALPSGEKKGFFARVFGSNS
jgi:ubiquinone biosynthesis protein UbiJ